LPSTSGGDTPAILDALHNLEAGGSTNGGQGLLLAYKVAQDHFIKGGVNRVILATDGDFNVGVTDQGSLLRLIEEKRESGIALSVLGFGMGNVKDSTMEKLADAGNGNYSYIDSLDEAQKVLVEQAGGTLVTVAKDVKIQVEFNPRAVAAYRLIGYENRLLKDQDFNDDKKDAGDMGAGHSVTALYELIPAGQPIETASIDPLKYQQPNGLSSAAATNEAMTVKIRYKEPDGQKSALMTSRWPRPARLRPRWDSPLPWRSSACCCARARSGGHRRLPKQSRSPDGSKARISTVTAPSSSGWPVRRRASRACRQRAEVTRQRVLPRRHVDAGRP